MKKRQLGAAFLLLWAAQAQAQDVDHAAALAGVNGLREGSGLPPLAYSAALEQAALAHAGDMARNGFFSHTGSSGSTLGTRLTRAGYGWCAAAENIAKGQPGLTEAMASWQASRGHRKNMLSREVTEVAVARGAGNIWVMVLARPGC
ncbi:CAP domain-containing protein [Leisingera sp. SS27]|uniref:CAP domain-containing protein n=1 Tax=Leisingera sp. SS27 TaxID=2979462 RepID=UPI0023305A2A|nr:CAP domain-containing protein [Leisingera sp. SS27]MDC0659790.1 CAP domain-containing protein [Leisingera sp. SS27]